MEATNRKKNLLVRSWKLHAVLLFVLLLFSLLLSNLGNLISYLVG